MVSPSRPGDPPLAQVGAGGFLRVVADPDAGVNHTGGGGGGGTDGRAGHDVVVETVVQVVLALKGVGAIDVLRGLDVALGVGGLPRGRVVEIYGPESSGKTTLTLQVIAEMQKQGGQCAFV